MDEKMKNSVSNSCQTDISYEQEIKVYKNLESYLKEKLYKSLDNSMAKNIDKGAIKNEMKKSCSVVSLQFLKKKTFEFKPGENKEPIPKKKPINKPKLLLDDLCWKMINKNLILKIKKKPPTLPTINSLNSLSPLNANKNKLKENNREDINKKGLFSCSLYRQKKDEICNKLNLKNIIENNETEKKFSFKSTEKLSPDRPNKNNKILINYKLANWDNSSGIEKYKKQKNDNKNKIIQLSFNKKVNITRNKSLSHLIEFNRKENKMLNSYLTNLTNFFNKNKSYLDLNNININPIFGFNSTKSFKSRFKYLYNENKLVLPLSELH